MQLRSLALPLALRARSALNRSALKALLIGVSLSACGDETRGNKTDAGRAPVSSSADARPHDTQASSSEQSEAETTNPAADAGPADGADAGGAHGESGAHPTDEGTSDAFTAGDASLPTSDGNDSTGTATGARGPFDSGSPGPHTEAGDARAESLDAGGDCDSDCTLRQRIDDALQALLDSGVTGGASVAVWREGEVVYAEGFGVKNEALEPVTRDTLFQIGSDTKKLTALTVLQGVAAGHFELESRVSELLPELELLAAPHALDELSTHDLLTMRSGLFNYTPWVHDPSDAQLAGVLYGTFAENEVQLLPPAVAWTYGNVNYSLLGMLVESAAERPWPTV